MVTSAHLDRWLDGYAAAWVDADPNAAAALFTPDATYRSNPFEEPHNGSEGIAEYWRDVTATQEDVEVRWGDPVVEGDVAGVEWWTTLRNEAADVTLAGILLLHFEGDSLCRALRECWHVEPERRQPPPGWGIADRTPLDGAAEHAARYAEGYRSAWAAGDVGSAVSLFGDEVVYRSTPFRQPHLGREGVMEYTSEAFAEERVEDVRFAVLAVEGSTAVYEYWTTLEESGQPTTLTGCDVMLLGPDGSCRELREHWHATDGFHHPFPDWGT